MAGTSTRVLHEIWLSETRENAYKAFDTFLEKYQAKYPDACECLRKDREVLMTFYEFPAEHWKQLRSSVATMFPVWRSMARCSLRPARFFEDSGSSRTRVGERVTA